MQFTYNTNLNSLYIENNMLLQYSQNSFSLYKSWSKYFSVCCQKKTSTLHNLFTPKNVSLKHFESKCLVISVYLRYSRDVVRFYLVGWGGGAMERLNNFIKAARCLDLARCFSIFHFN